MSGRYAIRSLQGSASMFLLGYGAVRDLRRAARAHGAADAELAAIDRLDAGTASIVDVGALEPLAELAGLPWRRLFPELVGAPGSRVEVVSGAE